MQSFGGKASRQKATWKEGKDRSILKWI